MVRGGSGLQLRVRLLVNRRPQISPVNAVAHTDYSQRGAPIRVALYDDRLEIENPGLLPFGITIDDLPRGVSKLRHRVIGRVFPELGLVEQWGSGIQRMASACRHAGLPDPHFEEIGFRFRATICSERAEAVVLEPVDERILDYLSCGEWRSTSENAAFVGRTTRTTRSRLVSLGGIGLVREIGTPPNDPRRSYYKA